MKTRYKRLSLILGGVALLGITVMLILSAFQQNLVFFHSPSDVSHGKVAVNRHFRIGGIVKDHSVKRSTDGLTVEFIITDTAVDIPVSYAGALPDLFREGKGVVAQGKLLADGSFHASQVLAKHDENYMPPDAAHAIDQAQRATKTMVLP